MSSSISPSTTGWIPDWKQPYNSSSSKPHVKTIFLTSQTDKQLNQNLIRKQAMNHIWENDHQGKNTVIQSMAKKLNIPLKEMPSLISYLKGEGWIRTFKGMKKQLRRYIGSESFKPIYEITTLGKNFKNKIFQSVLSTPPGLK